MLLAPDQLPRAVLGGEMRLAAIRIIVTGKPGLEIVSRTDVKPAQFVLKNIDVKSQAPPEGLEPSTSGLTVRCSTD